MFSCRSVSVQPSAPPIENAGHAGRLQRVRVLQQVGPRLRRRDTGVLERRHVVEDGRLVGALEDHAVEVALDRAERDPRRRVVLRHRGLHEVDRLERAARREVLDEAGLRDRREIGRIAALHRRREHGRRVVARRRVLDADARVGLRERGEHELEVRRLRARPDADDRELAADGGVLRRCRVGDSCSGRKTYCGEREDDSASAHRTPFSSLAGRCRDRWSGRRSAASGCRRRSRRCPPPARASGG